MFFTIDASHGIPYESDLLSTDVIVSSRKWPLAMHYETRTRHAHYVMIGVALQAGCNEFIPRVKLKERIDNQIYMDPFLSIFHNNVTSRWK